MTDDPATPCEPEPSDQAGSFEGLVGGTAPEVPVRQLLTALGDEFLAYVCATNVADIQRFRSGAEDALDEQRQEVFSAAVELARRFSLWRRPNASNDDHRPAPGDEYEPLVFSFGQFCQLTESGCTIAQEFRLASGGSVVELPAEDDDPVLRALLWLARDLWPYLLIAAKDDQHGLATSGAASASFNHPAQERLCQAVQLEREPLRQLFPNRADPMASSAGISSTSGAGGAVQLVLLGDHLLDSAARRSGWPHIQSEPAFLAEVEALLGQVRQLARGRGVNVPATIGLVGLELPDGTDVLETAVGTLHRWTREGTGEIDGPQPTLELRTSFPLNYTRVEQDVPDGPPRGFWEAWRDLEREVDRVRLAVLLADPAARTSPLRMVSVQVHDPLFRSARFMRPTGPLFVLEASADLQAGISKWAGLIDSHYHPSIALAIRRTISAADPLREPDDGLVDGVIALESLFGTGQSEVGFRLRTALAMLFGATLDERRAIDADVSDLYGARSKLVHGKHIEDRGALERQRQRAIKLALDSIRLLLSGHDDLIPDENRGKTLILRGGLPPDARDAVSAES